MTTITINKRTKAGKILFELAGILADKDGSVSIIETVSNSKTPNAKTLKAMKDAESKTYLISIKDKADFYKKMNL